MKMKKKREEDKSCVTIEIRRNIIYVSVSLVHFYPQE